MQREAKKKLSQAQKGVLKWLGKNWRAVPRSGDVWIINGGNSRQGLDCRSKTLEALEERGLTEKDQYGAWVATEAGKRLTRELGL